MGKVFVFDFDGVICNSIIECMHVSYKAYCRIDLKASETIPQGIQQDFLEYRYLIGPAKNFYFLWKAIIQAEKYSKRIDELYFELKSSKSGLENEFEKLFYSIRNEMKKNDYKQWILLNPIYEEMRQAFDNTIDVKNIFIVTAKDSDSVVDILHSNNILVNRTNIYGREISLNKVELFKQIIRDQKVKPENIYYLEDKLSILTDLKETGITCFLATWGYNSPGAVYKAEQNGINTISLNELDSFYDNVYSKSG